MSTIGKSAFWLGVARLKYQDISFGMKSSWILIGSLLYFATAYWVSQ
jgi:hypothetical protein